MVTLKDFIHKPKSYKNIDLLTDEAAGTTEKFCSIIHPQTQKLEPPLEHNKQHHRKVLLSSFHLNGHTLGFDPQTQKLEPPFRA